MKKVLSGLIALAFVVVLSSETLAQTKFKDVPTSHWAYNEVQFLTGKEIIYGYQDGDFKPGKSITRLQAVQMMLREKGIKDFSNVPNPGFADVKPGRSGYNEVAKAVELGIISGKVNAKGEKVFDPNGVLTRAQMAKILSLAYDLTGTSNEQFSDIPKTHWAYPYVQGLAKNQVTMGYSNGTFGGVDYLSRVQFAVMMARTLDESYRTTPTPPVSTEPTGKVYPDGWTAPVLESTWSPDHATNLATLQDELGFADGGRMYSIKGKTGAIQVVGQGTDAPFEAGIKFYMWRDTGLAEGYRIPIVSKELFKLYFGADAQRVWNYFENNDIPERFTANGRTVKASYSPADASVYLEVGKKK
ncbi:hypothetical protein BTO30_00525 [Domibacillus antri]|uniref:SLH domain-containing protein n=1 Tax=Domibacillus antri TaxID=1714264 RepID=A0A1Q8Q9C2_9BACI|nr:S-layer homology domain-containing protein [Domibacillus antri]OLN23948.1 hypothetical protein BTO30_00525 [Domibacillus antri]